MRLPMRVRLDCTCTGQISKCPFLRGEVEGGIDGCSLSLHARQSGVTRRCCWKPGVGEGGEVRLVRMVQYPEARPVQSRGLTKARPVQSLVWWPRAGCVDVGEWRRRTKKQTRS